MKKSILFSLIVLAASAYSCKNDNNKANEYPAEPLENLSHTIPDDSTKSSSPYFFVKSNYPTRATLFLKSTDVKAVIIDSIANVTVSQIYINTSQRRYDAIYIFPGSSRSLVSGLDMTVGKRFVYNGFKGFDGTYSEVDTIQAKRTLLLNHDSPGIFKAAIENIRPKDTVKVTLSYSEQLEYKDGKYEFIYPALAEARYSNQESGYTTQSMAQMMFQQHPQFNIHVTIDSRSPILALASSHETKITKDSDTRMNIALDNSKGTLENSDFVFNYETRK